MSAVVPDEIGFGRMECVLFKGLSIMLELQVVHNIDAREIYSHLRIQDYGKPFYYLHVYIL